MNSESNFPELLQAEWSQSQLLALLADLATGAEILHLQLRTTAQEKQATLEEVSESITTGIARAFQVRYLFDSELWCDTVLLGSPTSKIIRSRLAKC